MDSTRRRYLDKRSIAGPWQITGIKRSDYSGAIVIPACDEEKWIFRTLHSLANNPADLRENFLVLVVVNHPADTDRSIKIANRRTLEEFTASPLRKNLQLGWVDACSESYELAEGGVGSARKLGFDLALTRLRDDSDAILISLDADTLVESNYLEKIVQHFSVSSAGGTVIPFSHQLATNAAEQQAIDNYELYLRCYRLGLSLADSPYAFHTIGSAIACRSSAYVHCGGMNRRKGGEDFYFLQSLAKTSGVDYLYGTIVHPAARLSSRVPFGTGPALGRLINNPDEKIFYPLSAFDLLGDWLKLVSTSLDLSGTQLQAAATGLNHDLGSFLHKQKLTETWSRLAANHKSSQKLHQAFHTWFDGLKTQQLLKHLCQPDRYGMAAALEAAPSFLDRVGLASTGTVAGDLELLRKMQNLL